MPHLRQCRACFPAACLIRHLLCFPARGQSGNFRFRHFISFPLFVPATRLELVRPLRITAISTLRVCLFATRAYNSFPWQHLLLHVSLRWHDGLQVLAESPLEAQYHVRDDQALPQGQILVQDSGLHFILSREPGAELGDELKDLLFAFLILVHEPLSRTERESDAYETPALAFELRGHCPFVRQGWASLFVIPPGRARTSTTRGTSRFRGWSRTNGGKVQSLAGMPASHPEMTADVEQGICQAPIDFPARQGSSKSSGEIRSVPVFARPMGFGSHQENQEGRRTWYPCHCVPARGVEPRNRKV